jgi:hypothetical protein
MSVSKRVVFLSGPEDDNPDWEPSMKFRLTYSGPLRPTNRDPLDERPIDPLSTHKHRIRGERLPAGIALVDAYTGAGALQGGALAHDATMRANPTIRPVD